MSKIELTEAQTEKLRRVWLVETTHAKALVAVANELVAMGLVRPATDDLAARVAALEVQRGLQANQIADLQERMQIVEESIPDHPLMERVAALEAKVDAIAKVEEVRRVCYEASPDPHAVAKERAKLWGVELVTLKDGTCLFMTEKHYLSNPKPSWFPHVFSFRSPHYSGGHKTPSEAWSNFPTVPPPGREAPKGEFQKALDLVDARAEKIVAGIPPSQRAIISQAAAKPHTDADRLGALADAAYMAYTHDSWESHKQAAIPNDWRNVAHAVRKAVLARQLEPSEEEVKAALLCWRETLSTVAEMKDILAAAARVRLEKAEGEKP